MESKRKPGVNAKHVYSCLKKEEEYLKRIKEHFEDQLNRLRVEELALLKIIKENGDVSKEGSSSVQVGEDSSCSLNVNKEIAETQDEIEMTKSVTSKELEEVSIQADCDKDGNS